MSGIKATTLALAAALVMQSAANATETIYVDFDTILDAVAAGAAPGSPGIPAADELYEYSPAQRTEILSYLNVRYSVHDVLFIDGTPPVAGSASVVSVNKGGGGSSDGVDFRNLDGSDSADVNTIAAFKFVGKDAVTDPWTDDDVTLGTANLIGHEAGHLMGVRHQDSFGPIGTGIGTFPTDYAPIYPAPAGAPLTFESLSYLTTGLGLSFEGLTTPSYVSERAAIKMHYASTVADDFVVAETGAGDNHEVDTAQPLDLIFFDNPYPYRDPIDISMVPPEDLPVPVPVSLMGRTRTVVGSLSDTDGGGKFLPDYYSFKGIAGAPVTIEAMSAILQEGSRYADPADPTIILLDSAGAIIDYLPGPPLTPAANDDDFATSKLGASLIDVILPPVLDTDPETGLGTYVIELLAADSDLFFIDPAPGKDGMNGGSYELIVYQAAPVFILIPEPSTLAIALLAGGMGAIACRRRQ